MATKVPTLKLNSGADMPQVGFGLWKVDNAICADVVYNAIKTGYRLLDGACGKLIKHSALAYTHPSNPHHTCSGFFDPPAVVV